MRGARPIALASAVAAGVPLVRARYLRWGATDREAVTALPGDNFMPHADLTATRATTIRASPRHIWPWIAQLGQGRGGFYSYDRVENLVGCDIHSADRIMPKWQDLEVGDRVGLAPQMGLVVASVERGRSLVLRGAIPIGNTAPPYDFTWVFALQETSADDTRLLVRERYRYKQPWARLIVEPTEAISFLMTQKMLRGIKKRAVQTVPRPLGSDRNLSTGGARGTRLRNTLRPSE
jgi:hypothetical protein